LTLRESELSSIENSKIAKLVKEITEAAKRVRKEEDLKSEFEYLLRRFTETEKWGFVFHPKHEVTVVGGLIDAVFRHLVIEYKKPGTLKSSNEASPNQKALTQIKEKYLSSFGNEVEELRQNVGVVTDGQKIIFIRFHRSKWITSNPRPIDKASMRQFLYYLRALARKRLTAKELEHDFGSKSPIARRAINVFVKKLVSSDNPKVTMMYNEWDRIFGIVYGEDLKKAEKNVKELVETYDISCSKVSLKPLLFSLHTYYTLFIKLLAIDLLCEIKRLPSPLLEIPTLPLDATKRKMQEIEEGGIFAEVGIKNFLEGDFFAWYLELWDPEIESLIKNTVRVLQQYEPTTATLLPEETKDIMKKLYQNLVPKPIRHDLGEFYTPDWLAELVLDKIGYDGNPNSRILDPACGSGTFLVEAIKRVRSYAADNLLTNLVSLAERIRTNVVGFDINPLAVISARMNYLIALGNILPNWGRAEIPIYLCDSICVPFSSKEVDLHSGERLFAVHTSVGDFRISEIVVDQGKIDQLTSLIEECIEDECNPTEFLGAARFKLGLSIEDFDKQEVTFEQLYRSILKLHKQNKDKVWARIIRNSFAPLFVGKFDYVVGNPPWIQWMYLSEEYKSATREFWKYYRFFTQKGFRAVLPAGHLDFSALFTYVTADVYLKTGGRFGFVITKTLFKSLGCGEGFRRLELPDKTRLRICEVHDLEKIQPFEEAKNRTTFFALIKGEKTRYPISYIQWQRVKGASISSDLSLKEVRKRTNRRRLIAYPTYKKKELSPWTVVRSRKTIDVLQKIVGKADYQARMGVTPDGATGVFLVEILEKVPTGFVLIENLPELGKRKFRKRQKGLSADLVYPLLRGKGIRKWFATPNHYILVPHSPRDPKKGYKESIMKYRYPNAYAYFKIFKEKLLDRGFLKKLGPDRAFYSLWKIGPYTFAPYKVVWQRMTNKMTACVVGSWQDPFLGRKTIVPTDSVTLVPFRTLKEAHYFCAMVNSKFVRFSIRTHSGAGRGFGSPSILKYVRIPKFDSGNKAHKKLVELSKKAHALAKTKKKSELERVETLIDEHVARIYGIEKREIKLLEREGM